MFLLSVAPFNALTAIFAYAVSKLFFIISVAPFSTSILSRVITDAVRRFVSMVR